MLGNVTEKLAQPRVRVVTTRLRDAILASWQEVRTKYEPDRGIRFRCSDIAYLCPRMQTLAVKTGLVITEVNEAEGLWALGVGSAYHEVFQKAILPTIPGGVLQGWWRDSKHPYALHRGEALTRPPLSHKWIPQPNPSCTYEEMLMFDPDLKLSGKCDGILVWGPDDIEVLELKSAGAFKKDGLDPKLGGNPDAAHVLQAHCYMMLTGVRKCRIAYVIKVDGKLKDVVFEYLVDYDEGTANSIKTTLKTILEAVKEGRILPMLPTCTKKSNARAKKCPMRDICFKATADAESSASISP